MKGLVLVELLKEAATTTIHAIYEGTKKGNQNQQQIKRPNHREVAQL
jgi:hypothetical protein